MVLRFADICGIVAHHCLTFFLIKKWYLDRLVDKSLFAKGASND
jgi:hypothetical protein